MLQIDLNGKVAVVTGATGQLGRVMARTLAEGGAAVAIHYHRNRDKAEELLAGLAAAGARGMIVQADVAREGSVLAMRDAIAGTLGNPHIVVCNAVARFQWASVLEQDPADYEGQFRSSVLQAVHMARAFVPAMIARGGGRIIGISTECAMQNAPHQSAYISGKRGMDGVLRVLAREVGEHGITVNQVAPGWTISDRDRENGTERQEAYEQQVPLRRRGSDREIAQAVAFLASDLAGFISGVYLPVCGGNIMPAI